MAIGMIFDQPGGTQAQYEQVRDEVCPGNVPPPGMLYHAAGATEHGWCVIEVWESQEAAKRFFDDKLGRALGKVRFSAPPTIFQVANTMQP